MQNYATYSPHALESRLHSRAIFGVTHPTPLFSLNPYIFPKEVCVIHSLKKVEPLDLGPPYFAPRYLSMYIAYIPVSKATPWAVAGPHEQLASLKFSLPVYLE